MALLPLVVGPAPITKIPRRGSRPSGEEKKQKEPPAFASKSGGGQNPNSASLGRLAAIPHTLDPEAPAGLILNAIGVSL